MVELNKAPRVPQCRAATHRISQCNCIVQYMKLYFCFVLFCSEVPYSKGSMVLFKGACLNVIIAIILLLDLDLLRNNFASGTCQSCGSLQLNCNMQRNNFALEYKLVELQ